MKLRTFLKHSKSSLSAMPAVSKSGDQYAQLTEAAQRAKTQSRWQEAADLYEEVYGLRESFGVMVQMGHMNKEAGNLKKAEECYFKALEKKPEDPDLNLQIGHFFFVQGDLEQSVNYYRKAVDLDPDNASYVENLKIGERRLFEAPFKDQLEAALKALRLRQWAEAERLLRLVHDKGVVDYVHLLGDAVKEQGRVDEAIGFYEVYYDHLKLELRPELADVASMIGQTLRIAGRYSEAATWLMQARALRMEREGWVGSVDNLLNDVEASLKRVYPWLETSYVR